MSIKSILTFFGPKTLETRTSKFNTQVVVKRGWGYTYLTTNNQSVTQSGGIVKEVWDPALRKIGIKNKSWLILGLAGATLARQINDLFPPTKIVGVEIDPVMIKMAKKYFDLDAIPHLEVVNMDAKKYMANLKSKFDFLLVDLYFGEKPPPFIYSEVFISQLKKNSSVVVINHLFYNSSSKDAASSLIKLLSKHFPNVSLVRSLANLLIIART